LRIVIGKGVVYNNTKNSEIYFFNFEGYCGVATDRRRDLGWNPSTLTVLNFKLFFFIEKVAK
jgi:hypothetical protein